MKKRNPIKNLKSVKEVPEFSSEQQEAEFWQTHSPVLIFDELPKAEDVEFVPRSKRLIPLPLDEQVYKMSQLDSWEAMQPHFNQLNEGMTFRRRAESDRINAVIESELRSKRMVNIDNWDNGAD